jgi:hypothetical protein
MPSEKTKIVARHNLLLKFTRKLYKTEPNLLGRCPGTQDLRRSSRHLGNLKKLTVRIMIDIMSNPENTRRWPRVPVDMPVRVLTSKGFSTTVVEGRGTELSEGGMVLYAGILLNPGDLLEIEFDTPIHSRMTAIVRTRTGFCFGLEFITPLPA